MSDSPSSYKEKISPELDGLLKSMLGIFDLLELSEIKALLLHPELYKSFEAEGIPSWTLRYTSKIPLGEIFFLIFFSHETRRGLAIKIEE